MNVKQLLKDGYDLFLSANGVVLIYDGVSLEYFHVVEKCPYLGFCVFSPGVPHSLPREVQNGKWRDTMRLRRKYEEYLSSFFWLGAAWVKSRAERPSVSEVS